LLTFPVPIQRLDIFTHFLSSAHLKPAQHKSVESLELMLQMTELQRGVCVLPRWLAASRCQGGRLETLRLGKNGMQRKLYIAMRGADKDIAYIRRFIEVGREMVVQSF